jgi:type IV pilus assembly protein PilE
MAKTSGKARFHHRPRHMARSRHGGFSLIELMIVVAIVAILTAIALPQYRKQIQKSNRSAAKSALLDLARREETYYSTNNSYTLDLATLGYASVANNSIQVPSSSNPLYTVGFSAPAAAGSSATTYTATATPTGSQVGDSCGNFSVDYLGNQQATGTANGSSGCW